MPNSTHAFSPAVRTEMLLMLREAHDPATDFTRRMMILQDCIEWLEGDTIRSGYARRFWERCDSESKPPHIIWHGAGQDSPEGRPICDFEGKRVYAAKVAWFLRKVERIPDNEILRKTCDVPRCVSDACHHRLPRESNLGGRPTVVRRDEEGRPLCKRGHALKREPKPREHVYCAACRTYERRLIQEADLARIAIRSFNPQDHAKVLQTIPTLFDTPPDERTVPSSPPPPARSDAWDGEECPDLLCENEEHPNCVPERRWGYVPSAAPTIKA